ncbi:hypothetical protein A3J78_00830 [Candidatus Beckwithbacteria bacterium RBG_13_35_6]|uniref:PIN domain-containing protein n=1 Tax=Candidatus Beckwithbacteria bacterium RBG_13_35_6 TaxID=1797456 RepID=A0A1F5DIA6_9BACT|nr:MAG: hypothetical protein A3J78_00830 [Candidatus Beckwithbacteria bacterium RBG_13_35_6]
MKKLVVDTDIIIDYLRQINQETLLKGFLQNKNLKIYIAAIAITELWKGDNITKLQEKNQVEGLLSKLKIIIADKKISQKAGEILRKYHHLMLADALVAATAIVENAELVTFNKKHFNKVEKMKLYNF